MYGYNERKAAQVAAFFAMKQGGRINVLKLAKLMYLAERESMDQLDEPMFFDKLVSMDHGPVASMSLNLLNGLEQGEHWADFVTDRDRYEVGCVEGVTMASLDCLARADLRVLEGLWEKFGAFGQYELRDWTHQNCPEWENPRGSSAAIPHDRVFKFFGKKDADGLAESVSEHRATSRVFELSC